MEEKINEVIIDATQKEKWEKIERGDDGVVLKNVQGDHPQVAIKVFVTKVSMENALRDNGEGGFTDDPHGQISFGLAISKDQATREIKALTLLKAHPNFIKLAQNNLKEITFVDEQKRRLAKVPCIYLKFEDNMFDIREVSRLFGFEQGTGGTHVLSTPTITTMNTMNFENRNILFKFTMNQIYDAATTMHEKHITHRDLDICNVKMLYPSFQVKIMDFSRAVVPKLDPFDDTEDPRNICASARKFIKTLQQFIRQGTGRWRNKKPYDTYVKMWEYIEKQYKNPLTEHTDLWKVPRYKDFSDDMEIAYLLERILSEHLNFYEWSESGIDQDTTIQENSLLINFVDHCNKLSLEAAKNATSVNQQDIKSIPRVPLQSISHYFTEHKASSGGRSRTVDILSHPRFVIHSDAWTASYDTVQKSSNI